MVFSRELPDMSNTDSSLGKELLEKPWMYSSSSVAARLMVSLTTMFERVLALKATAEFGKGNGNRAS